MLAGRLARLARILAFKAHCFDIGPHRFFTLNGEVRAPFRDIGGEDIVRVPRPILTFEDRGVDRFGRRRAHGAGQRAKLRRSRENRRCALQR